MGKFEDTRSASLYVCTSLERQSSVESAKYNQEDPFYQRPEAPKEPEKKSFRKIIFPDGFGIELKAMFGLTWPIIFTSMFQLLFMPISLMFCGHLDDPILLNGAALALSMINVTCVSVAQGLGTACDTFFSQTFGAKNKLKVGICVQRATCIMLLALPICFTFHLNMEGFLLLIGQHPEVARLTGRYILIFMPGAFCFFMYVVLSKWIQNQNIVIPNAVIGLIANAINAFLHYIFLYRLDYQLDGSAAALAISYSSLFVLTLLYILISGKYRDTWPGFSLQALQEWGQFCRLAIPGMLMLCMEWWGFEIGVILCGLLGITELGAQSIVLQLDSLWFQVPFGLQLATSIRIGQFIGAGCIDAAKTTARVGLTFTRKKGHCLSSDDAILVMLSMVVALLFGFGRHVLPRIFTDVTATVDLVSHLLPIVAIYMFFDAIATLCKGVLCGTGRQLLGAAILFVSYYCIALPIGIPLMFLTALKSAGYWMALALNLILQAFVLLFLVIRTNWDAQVTTARQRAGLIRENWGERTRDDDVITECLLKLYIAALLRSSSQTGPSASCYLSTSLSDATIRVLATESNLPLRVVLLRRFMAFAVVMAILIGGICCRIFIPKPHFNIEQGNNTLVMHNNTLLPFLSDTTANLFS